mmetsp:Transcript_100497/g.322477  ORF Transcript_100497/g.322477 Transcript_100497/m.322477 type:complete len:239 (+) Transcript_100497:286-1002(+)
MLRAESALKTELHLAEQAVAAKCRLLKIHDAAADRHCQWDGQRPTPMKNQGADVADVHPDVQHRSPCRPNRVEQGCQLEAGILALYLLQLCIALGRFKRRSGLNLLTNRVDLLQQRLIPFAATSAGAKHRDGDDNPKQREHQDARDARDPDHSHVPWQALRSQGCVQEVDGLPIHNPSFDNLWQRRPLPSERDHAVQHERPENADGIGESCGARRGVQTQQRHVVNDEAQQWVGENLG